MKFEEALVLLREGKKMHRIGWDKINYVYLNNRKIFDDQSLLDVPNCDDLLADDWEIYQEQWEPEGGDWYIGYDSYVRKGKLDSNSCKFGMERPSKELAEKHRDRLRTFNRLAAYVDEFAPDFEPDWVNYEESKYYVSYDHKEERWYRGYNVAYHHVGTLYMPEEIAEQLVNDLNSGRVKI